MKNVLTFFVILQTITFSWPAISQPLVTAHPVNYKPEKEKKR